MSISVTKPRFAPLFAAVCASVFYLALGCGAGVAYADVSGTVASEEGEVVALHRVTERELAGLIEGALKKHETMLEFDDDMFVDPEIASNITYYVKTIGYAGSPANAATPQKGTDYKLLYDRYAAYPNGWLCVTDENGTQLKDMRFRYWFSADEVAKANKIVASVAEKASKKGSKYQKIKYIHDWVVKNAAYEGITSSKWGKSTRYGVTSDKVNRTSVAQILSHRGKCHTYSLTFLQICKQAGISGKYISCKCYGSSVTNHGITAVKYGGKWRYLDVTWDEIHRQRGNGTVYEQPDRVKYTYYMKSRTYMNAHDHRF